MCCYSAGMQQLHGDLSVMVSNKIGESDLNTEVTIYLLGLTSYFYNGILFWTGQG